MSVKDLLKNVIDYVFPVTYKLPNVEYGQSPNNHEPIVLNDPYQFSPSRLFIALTIVVITVAVVVLLYPKFRRETSLSLLQAKNRTNLYFYVCLSIIVGAIHHIDNFVRVNDYFMSIFLYHGILFILDIGLYYWLVSSAFIAYGASTLFAAEESTSLTIRLSFYAIYLHCVMIWISPILHWTVEPIYAYQALANLSIICEGCASVSLNVYAVYLSHTLCKTSSGSGGEYSALPTVEMSGSVGGDISEDGAQPLRRRSKGDQGKC